MSKTDESRFHQGNRLRWLIENSIVKIADISEKSNIPVSSLYDLYKKEDIPRAKLEALCKVMEWDIKQFYPELFTGVEEPAASYEILKERAKSLEQMIKDKEVIIIQQTEIIELLKKSKRK